MMMVVVKSISSFLVVLRLAAGVDDVRARRVEKNFFVCVLFSRQKHTQKRGHFRRQKDFLSCSKDGETRR